MSLFEKKEVLSEFVPSSSKKFTQLKSSDLFSASYGLVDEKDKTSKNENLDLFSQISKESVFESLSLKDAKETEIPSSISLSQLVTIISDELSGGKVNVDRIQQIMQNYDHTLGEWKRFAYWNKEKLYTRNLIATDDKTFTLMLLCWNPSTFSPIHDHAGVECVLRVIQGEIQEKKYEYPGDDLTKELEHLSTETVKPGETTFINDSIAIHSVGNASSEFGATLHCYMPPYSKCRCFLDETSADSIDAYVTFDTENGEPTSTCTKGATITTAS